MTTASRTSKDKAVAFDDFARDIARRRAETGQPDLPRNSGKRRTASKKALLEAVEQAGGRW